MKKTIAFQGVLGAYSHLACQELYPEDNYLPCSSFDEAFSSVQSGKADLAVIPIENSAAGRVADVHFLLSQTPLYIIGEHFLHIHHQLIGLPGSKLNEIKTAFSHPQALAQCSKFLKHRGIIPLAQDDTAHSCELIINNHDTSIAAIASKSAALLYNLPILSSDIENAANNTTRFLVMSREHKIPQDNGEKFITSLIFKAKNIPAALYKALGGFATNAINLSKLESYLLGGKFFAAQFYIEVESHPDRQAFKNALSELQFFSDEITILGTYRSHPYREADI